MDHFQCTGSDMYILLEHCSIHTYVCVHKCTFEQFTDCMLHLGSHFELSLASSLVLFGHEVKYSVTVAVLRLTLEISSLCNIINCTYSHVMALSTYVLFVCISLCCGML